MGTSYTFVFECDSAKKAEMLACLAGELNDKHNNGSYLAGMYGRRSQEMKWDPEDLLCKLSGKFPDVTIRLDLDSYDGRDTIFFREGYAISGSWALPKFPTRAKMIAGIKSIKQQAKANERNLKLAKLAALDAEREKIKAELGV